MATYYVFIPASEMPTAEITASNTKHARTAYLDYLTRSGQFPYSQRGTIRDAIATKSIEPGEYPVDLKLEYGVTEPLESEVEEVPTPNLRSSYGSVPMQYEPRPEEEEVYNQGHINRMEEEESNYDQGKTQQPTNPFGSSPVMNLSKKSGGM